MKSKKAVFVLMIAGAIFSFLAGCTAAEDAGAFAGKVTQLNDSPIDLAGATEITLAPEEKVQTGLLQESFSVVKGGSDEKTYFTVDSCRRNEDGGFYQVSYSENMAQFSCLNRIYHVDLETGDRALLYETEEAYWLNEFEAGHDFLYWVEYIWAEAEEQECGTTYRVIQYELATGEVKCIAERSAEEFFDICLAVSEQYVTWYDDDNNGRADIVLYDVKKQEFCVLTGAKKFSRYERPDIVDGGITYFSEDEEGKYIGWLTDYDYLKSVYYFYDMETGNLHSFRESEEMNVFSMRLSDYLYFNSSDQDGIYTLHVCDLASGKSWKQELKGHGMQFRECGDGQVYLEIRSEEEAEVAVVRMPRD